MLTTLKCDEFDEFVSNLAGLDGRYILRERSSASWHLTSIELDGVMISCGQEGAARVYDGSAGRDVFHVFALLDGRCAVVDGNAFNSGEVALVPPGGTFHTATATPIAWLNITIRSDLILEAMPNHGMAQGATTFRHSGAAPFVDIAQRMIEAERLTPGLVRGDITGRCARTQLLATVHAALAATPRPFERRNLSHKSTVQLALAYMQSLGDEMASMPELCKAIGVCDRTLRDAFNACFGMAPHQYLCARRLHAMRDAIRCASGHDTVTSICARFGVWDYGRFASAYRRQFGILPSLALRKGVRPTSSNNPPAYRVAARARA